MKNFTKHRKVTFLVAAFISATSIVQAEIPEIIFSENFDGFYENSLAAPGVKQVTLTSSPKLDECTQISGWAGNRVYQAGGAVKLGAASDMGYVTTPFVDLSASGGRFYIWFKAMVAQAGDSTVVRIATNNGKGNVINGEIKTIKPYSTDLVLEEYGPIEIHGDLGTNTALRIKVQGANLTGRIFLDDLVISNVVPYATITKKIFRTGVGKSQNQLLDLTALNITDDLTIMLTNTNGTAFSTTTATVTVAEAEAGYQLSVDYEPTDAGNHTANVILSGGGMADDVTVELVGSAYEAIAVTKLSDLRSAYTTDSDPSKIYRISSEVIASYSNTSGIYKYIQDNTGGIMIFDPGKVITDSTRIGDGFINLIGTLGETNNVLEFYPIENVTASSMNNIIEPAVLTIPELLSQIDRFESVVVRINNLNNMSGKSIWENFSWEYLFETVTSESITIRTNYATNYWGLAIPSGKADYVGIVLDSATGVKLFPRNLDDIKDGFLSVDDNIDSEDQVLISEDKLKILDSRGDKLDIFDFMGRKIISKTINDECETYTLKKGQIYLVKIGNKVSKVAL